MSQNVEQDTYRNEATTALPGFIAADEDDSARARLEAHAARDKALGKVEAAAPVPAPPVAQKRITDKFFGSFGLFALRLVAAASLGVRGYQHLTDVHGFTTFLTTAGLPYPQYLSWGIAIAEVLAAVALLFGVLTREAALGLAALAIGALVFIEWGATNPFRSGIAGFNGELELVLAGVGLALACLGGGRWSIDGSVRAGRQAARAAL